MLLRSLGARATLSLLALAAEATRLLVRPEAFLHRLLLRPLQRLRLLLLSLNLLEHLIPVFLIQPRLLLLALRHETPRALHLGLVDGAATLRQRARLRHHRERPLVATSRRVEASPLLLHRRHGLTHAGDGGVQNLRRTFRANTARGGGSTSGGDRGGGGGRSAEDGGAGDARDASRLLGRRGGHRAARGVEDVHTLETDLLVVFPLVALKFGVEAGIGEVGDALGDEHGGLDAVLQAGADGSGGGEHGRGAHARVTVRDVVDGHRAEVEFAHGLSNPRLRRCEGRRGGQGRDGVRRRRASEWWPIRRVGEFAAGGVGRTRTRGLSSEATFVGLSPGDRKGAPGEDGMS